MPSIQWFELNLLISTIMVYDSIDISTVVCIDDWGDLEDALAGSRVKTTVSDPATQQLYIFKQPKRGREAQIWSELLASFIAGDLLGWPVQHARIAVRDGDVGNLLAYVYRHDVDQLVAGEQLCKHVDPDFDAKQGKRHTWGLVKRIHDEFIAVSPTGETLVYTSRAFILYWARTIAFDTLISNTDRHAENWALSLGPEKTEIMAPFFDNASSMGCEVDEVALQRKWLTNEGGLIVSKVESYVAKGCHHLREENDRYGFEALARVVIDEFPVTISEFEAVANLDLSSVADLIENIKNIDGLTEATKLSAGRGAQILRLLHEGQARVRRCLQEIR